MIRYVCLLLLGFAGCAQRHSPISQPDAPRTSIILIWIDGLTQAALQEGLANDSLPSLKHHFADGGRVFSNAVVSLPSLTYVNAAGLLTGCWPYQHGVYGNVWFDPETGQERNYDSVIGFDKINVDLRVPTVHEHIRKHQTLSVQCHTQRGADLKRNNVITSGLAWLGGNWKAVERNAAREILSLACTPDEHWPGLALVYFPTADANAHETGLGTDYQQALQRIDTQVGNIVRTVRDSADDGREVYFVVVTDHGQVAVPPAQRFDLEDWLQANRTTGKWIIGAPRRAVVHLPASDDPWAWIDHESAVWDLPAVDFVAARRGPAIEVASRAGRCRIEADGQRYRLQELEGGLAATIGPTAVWLSDREWLAQTAARSRPDLVPQLFRYFDDPRSGDVLLMAAPGWGLEADSPAGHGGADAEEMRVSFLWSGAGIRIGPDPTPIRAIDLVPTILDLLDEQPLQPLPGRSFAPRLLGHPVSER